MRHSILVSVVSVCCATHVALGQGTPTFSVDFQGPVIGVPEAFSPLLISEGDILTTTPLPAPAVPIPPGISGAGRFNPFAIPDLGLPGFPPPAPGVPSGVEVDALSFGIDHVLRNTPTMPHDLLLFSVDEFATGFPTGSPPEVAGQGAAGAGEASADVYMYFAPVPLMPVVPAPPFGMPPGNTQLFDGDGLAAPFGPILPGLPFAPAPHGVGLVEPNPPTPGAMPDPGDNLDALDVDNQKMGTPLLFPVYYSLDSGFFDPIEGPPANTASAAALGFVGGDVLTTPLPGGVPIVYAPAPILGLDLVGGADSDDLDALILFENGMPGYQASGTPGPPFDWGPGMPADMLLFSVRRGSAVIGMPDSVFGLPIAEGDILAPPLPGGGSPFPAIFIAAENLGLTTVFAVRGGPAPGPFGSDDLDALDLTPDCNANGVPDNLDISYGTGLDCNGNGFLDACEIGAGAPDCNSDGIPDDCQLDTDADGAINDCDADDDNDGVTDGGDTSPLDPDVCGDSDADGCDDCVVGSDDFGPLPDVDAGADGLDTDGDGLCDAGDPDDDNDGVDDVDDPAPLDADVCGDSDTDGCDDCDAGCTSGSCTTLADCADTDSDTVRDDNCIWWECIAGTCSGTNIVFADMGGQFGTCPPDGTADGNDRFHALNCFANENADGSTPYDCESAAPSAYNVDAGGPFGACAPDGVCDGNDAFHALNSFSGASTCTCPAGPAPVVSPTVTDSVSLTLAADVTRVRPGGFVEVDVYFDQPLDDLRGYQLHVETHGGSAGALRLLDIAIDDRADPVFGDDESFSAFNVVTGQMFAGLEGAGIATSADGYLATFVFQASKHASGAFVIELLHNDALPEHRTFLTPTTVGAKIAVESANALTIDVIGRRTGRTGKR